MSDGVSVKKWIIGVLVKRTICRILARVIASIIKQVKLKNIWLLKTVLVKNALLECEGEILNAAETIKMEHAKRNNCLVHTILLVITCLLLVVGVSISGYYYYTADWM